MENYWGDLKSFENGRSSSNHILNTKTREQLNMMYSCPATLPIPPHLERPPSPVDAIKRSCDFLTREYEKGFMPKFDAENYQKTLLRPALLAKANHKLKQKNTQKFDLEKLYETEKYQEFWLTSDTVSKIKKEISRLPFITSSDIQVVIGRFLELVASVVRNMKNKNMLDDENKQSKKQLRATMVHFINEAKVARHKAFKYAFQQEFIDLDKLEDAYKVEFKDEIPKYSRQQNRNKKMPTYINYTDASIDEKMVERYSLICDQLPNAYRMECYQISEDKQAKNRIEIRKFVNDLPKQILNGITQIDLQKSHSEPIINPHNIDNDIGKENNNKKDNINNISSQNHDFQIDSEGFLIYDKFPSDKDENNKFQNLDFDILNSCNAKIKIPPIKIIKNPVEDKKNDSCNTISANSQQDNSIPQNIPFDYWNSFDPLCNTRVGDNKLDSISQIHKISSNFKTKNVQLDDFNLSLPFKLEYDEMASNKADKPIQERIVRNGNKKKNRKKNIIMSSNEKSKGPTLIGEIWTTSDIMNNTSHNINFDEEEEEEEESSEDFTLNGESTSNTKGFYQMSLESERRNNDIMKFLQAFKFNKSSKRSSLIVRKLQEIWEKLGFSVQQKISLLVKYTSSTEESQKLNEALNFWELALGIVSRYNDSYQSLKDFIRFEAPTSHNANSTCKILKQQIESCEEDVKQIAEKLLATFGDELIIKKKTVQEIIPQRHKKMMDMINPYYDC